MSEKSLIFVLDAHLPYARDADTAGTVEEWRLFNALTFTYLPLLRSFSGMEKDSVPFHIAIAFSPELLEMLSDTLLQERYEGHLKSSIKYAERLLAGDRLSGLKRKTLEGHLELLRKNHEDFAGAYGRNILKKVAYFAERGFVELLACPATPCFFPFYQDIPEAISAQIETGLMARRTRFAPAPDGFWLPALGWFPGLEKALRAYGLRYSIVENTALLFSKEPPSAGIFAPAACENGFAVFPRDSFAFAEIAGQEGGFCHNRAYLDTEHDIGFTLDVEELAPLFDARLGRRVTGFRFFSRGEGAQAADAPLYDSGIALRQAEDDARTFIEKSRDMLSKASALLEGDAVCRTCAFPASLFGSLWLEGVAWLEAVFRLTASMEGISFDCPSSFLKRLSAQKGKLKTAYPVFSSWLEGGYADEILNSSNDWAYQPVKKASARMVDLAERFPGDKALTDRILNAAAREVLLAQSIDWPLLMNGAASLDYARARLEERLKAFTTVYESLGSNDVSTEWLAEMEKKHPLFPFMNYRVFCRRR